MGYARWVIGEVGARARRGGWGWSACGEERAARSEADVRWHRPQHLSTSGDSQLEARLWTQPESALDAATIEAALECGRRGGSVEEAKEAAPSAALPYRFKVEAARLRPLLPPPEPLPEGHPDARPLGDIELVE